MGFDVNYRYMYKVIKYSYVGSYKMRKLFYGVRGNVLEMWLYIYLRKFWSKFKVLVKVNIIKKRKF